MTYNFSGINNMWELLYNINNSYIGIIERY